MPLPDYARIEAQTPIENLAEAIRLMDGIDRRLYNSHAVHGHNPCPSREEFTELRTLITHALQDLQSESPPQVQSPSSGQS